MFIAIIVIFAICWLPYHMFYVYAYHQPHITSTNITPHLFLAFYWFAMANSMVNPIIYYWMNRRFRHYFQRILCFCCFRLWKMDDTFLQRNSMSIERKPRLCKYFNIIFVTMPPVNAVDCIFVKLFSNNVFHLWTDFKLYILILACEKCFILLFFFFVFFYIFCGWIRLVSWNSHFLSVFQSFHKIIQTNIKQFFKMFRSFILKPSFRLTKRLKPDKTSGYMTNLAK